MTNFKKVLKKSGKGYNKTTEALREKLTEQDTNDNGNDQFRYKSDLDFFLFHLDSFLLSMKLYCLCTKDSCFIKFAQKVD